MFFGHFSQKEVRLIVNKVEKEYKALLENKQQRINELIEKNRELSAQLSEYENKEDEISSAILSSVEAGKKIEERSSDYVQNRLRGLKLLSDRCKNLVEDIREKYPDVDDTGEFATFFEKMEEVLGEEESGFDREIAAPIEKDLSELCKELGIEDDGEYDKEFIIFDDDETDEKNADH